MTLKTAGRFNLALTFDSSLNLQHAPCPKFYGAAALWRHPSRLSLKCHRSLRPVLTPRPPVGPPGHGDHSEASC
eukprot:1119390-Pleurochrysis_carterae.AAC.1